MDAPAQARPYPALMDWLSENGIDHEIHEHAATFTAASTARAEGVSARTFAKVVGVIADDDRKALIVLDAPDHVDLRKVAKIMDAKEARLMTEPELAAAAPGCEPGATPAVGSLFGSPMYADHAVRGDPEISFNAGTHRHAVRVDRVAWEQATGVQFGDLAVYEERLPAWALS
jgi:Ala-tRNA(Pro) deacylase